MFLGLSITEMLVLSLFFMTTINCILTYYCCNKSLKILDNDNSIGKAISKLRMFDDYVLSKINMIVAIFYFVLSYLFVESKIGESNYDFFLGCVLSFPLTLITTFASRVCYCYTCNLLLETKLNEIECLIVNFKRLFSIYLPFLIISFVVPTVYLFDFSEHILTVICIIILLLVLVFWVFISPKVTVLNCKAKEIEKNTLLRYRLEKLMDKHGVKKYKLYVWDSSRSKESNAMVSGFITNYLFISSSLIEDVTLPELETVITHEIGHVKNNHLIKMLFGKIFIMCLLIGFAIMPSLLKLDEFEQILFYLLSICVACFILVIGVKIERKYEEQADMYATGYNDPELFASALRKITKYEEDNAITKFDELFSSHPNFNDRINKSQK